MACWLASGAMGPPHCLSMARSGWQEVAVAHEWLVSQRRSHPAPLPHAGRMPTVGELCWFIAGCWGQRVPCV